MIVLLSPAKSLNFESPYPKVKETEPVFIDRANQLALSLKKVSSKKLQSLMDISAELGDLNRERYASWEDPDFQTQARACLFAFDGDVYDGFQPYSLSGEALTRTIERVRILSGLYGLLRPTDRILPYRLEMGTKWPSSKNTLAAGWKKKVTNVLQSELQKNDNSFVVNLASQEYSDAVDFASLGFSVVHPVFEDEKNGHFKIISFLAKKARGFMARWIVENGIQSLSELESFDRNGYRLDRKAGDRWYYRRSGF